MSQQVDHLIPPHPYRHEAHVSRPLLIHKPRDLRVQLRCLTRNRHACNLLLSQPLARIITTTIDRFLVPQHQNLPPLPPSCQQQLIQRAQLPAACKQLLQLHLPGGGEVQLQVGVWRVAHLLQLLDYVFYGADGDVTFAFGQVGEVAGEDGGVVASLGGGEGDREGDFDEGARGGARELFAGAAEGECLDVFEAVSFGFAGEVGTIGEGEG